jgi:hypothetical protein
MRVIATNLTDAQRDALADSLGGAPASAAVRAGLRMLAETQGQPGVGEAIAALDAQRPERDRRGRQYSGDSRRLGLRMCEAELAAASELRLGVGRTRESVRSVLRRAARAWVEATGGQWPVGRAA